MTVDMSLPEQRYPHIYLSTGCLHGRHDYCQGKTTGDGTAKAPGRCKFCTAKCICVCHTSRSTVCKE